jgi:hypothetical protein
MGTSVISKNPGPEGPALVHSRSEVYGTKTCGGHACLRKAISKKNSIQHSVRNGLSAGQSLCTLTWPRGPGFMNRINLNYH